VGWMIRVSIPARARDFSKMYRLESIRHPIHWVPWALPLGVACLHLMPRLRTSGNKPLLPIYAFMMWTGTALPFN
jgi:hypothetical protein